MNNQAQSEQNNTVLFEYPLNEKMRTWLRIEFLLNQIKRNISDNPNSALSFFSSMSELLEVIDREDLKPDLIADLEDKHAKLKLWESAPDINLQSLNKKLVEFDDCLKELKKESNEVNELKEDKLFSSIRKRRMIPGGCCGFDLPNFHLWMALPSSERRQEIDKLLLLIKTLDDAVFLILEYVRATGFFNNKKVLESYTQVNDSMLNLLRIKVSTDYKVYPQISGNGLRFTLRFLPFNEQDDNGRDIEVEYKMALS